MTTKESTDILSTERRALLALRNVRAQLDAVEQAKTEPIAIIGMGCRFPGGADTPERFWELISGEEDTTSEIPKSRWDVDAYYEPEIDSLRPGQTYCRSGSFLDPIDQFDARFFGISPREAAMLDPQQRLLLEVSWEALEHAGLPPSKLMGSNSGVFIGIESQDYFSLTTNPIEQGNLYTATGGEMSVGAGRLAYYLGLHGPTLSIDTACSSSLAAVHLACQSLRSGECDMALVGGISLTLTPQLIVLGCQNRAMAPDGRCKTFDAAADGTGVGEGCGIVILKRLSKAMADGDNILGLICGSAINHDGRSSGLAVPNGAAQRDLIRQALKSAQVEPDLVSYIEAHGTGTPLGDPIEVEALGAVFNERTQPLLVGSVKSQIGHLMCAAGIAGLIKSLLSLKNQTVPAQRFFHTPNPVIPWQDLSVEVPTTTRPFPQVEGRRVAGISAFGVSGTNAHVIVEAYDPAESSIERSPSVDDSVENIDFQNHLLTLSSKTDSALRALAQRYAQHLTTMDQRLADICYTANVGRDHMDYRASVIGRTPADLRQELQQIATGETTIQRAANKVRLAFLFTGQEAQYAEMGRELYESEPIFRATFDHCDEIARPYLVGDTLSSYLYPKKRDVEAHEAHSVDLNDMAYSQLTLFAVEYALAQLWQAWGIELDFVIGHSMGEYVAACVAGVFSVDDAVMMLGERSKLIQSLPENGAMVAIFAPKEQVAAAIAPYENVVIALVNGPESVVISGEREAVHEVETTLAESGLRTRRLAATRGGHSPLLDPILAPFESIARRVSYHRPKIRLISNVSGKVAGEEITTPEYWVRQTHQTVQFADGVTTLLANGCNLFVEIGPRPLLLKMCMYMVPDEVKLLPSLHPEQGNRQQMLETLSVLYQRGVNVDWAAYHASQQREGERLRKVILPTYPFQRQRYWVDGANQRKTSGQTLRPLIDKMTKLPLHKEIVFETELSVDAYPYLADHQVYDAVVLPGAAYATMVLHGAAVALDGQAYEIEDMILPQALVLPETGSRTAQLIFRPVTETNNATPRATTRATTQEFQLISFDAEQAHAEPLIHATGRLRNLPIRQGDQRSIPKLKEAYTEIISVDGFYKKMNGGGGQLGPNFQWLVELRQGDKEALGHLQLPEEIPSVAGYALHPCLLDGCFQVTGATLGHQKTDENVSMPFAVAQLRLYQPAHGTEWWCHAIQTDQQRWEITLFDSSGALIAEIAGYEERDASVQTVLNRESWHDWLYEIQWQPESQEEPAVAQNGVVAPGGTTAPRQWLLLADRDGYAEALALRLREQGDDVHLVYSGRGYQEIDEQRTEINPTAVDDYIRLLQSRPDLHGVVHLWSFGQGGAEEEALAETAVRSCDSALLLTQALLQQQSTLPTLWLVTQDAQAVHSDDCVTGVAQSPLWGLGRTIALEHPEMHCVCVDLDRSSEPESNPTPESAHVTDLLTELSHSDRERNVAYRQGVRHVARIVPSQPPTTPKPSANESLLIQEKQSYLITGGLGNLGIKIACWLVEQGARHLVLMGRRGAYAEAAQNTLHELEEMGAHISVVKGDVSQREDVARAIAQCQAVAPLGGVIHAAMVIDDGILINQTTAQFNRVMGPKIYGAWHLHQLTQGIDLNFFVNFSSDVSILGAAGQSNYAAANAFLDALAHHRHANGLPALSINWGAWENDDEQSAFSARQQAQLTSIGAGYIPADLGLAILGQLIDQGIEEQAEERVAQMAVLPMEWATWLQQLDGQELDGQPLNSQVPPLFEKLHGEAEKSSPPTQEVFLEKLEKTPAADRHQLLTDHVQEMAGDVLGFESNGNASEQIALQQNFFDFGMDSLTSIELRNRLRKSLGRTLPATLAFNNPTVEAVVDYLTDEVHILAEVEQTAPNRTDNGYSNGPNNETAPPSGNTFSTSLVRLQDGEKPPVFFVAGVIGLVFNFYPLVRYLPGQLFYALQTPGLDGEMEPYATIEEIAAHHIQALQIVQPEGPYRIGGHSVGSKVVMEMVNQLLGQGHEVSLMIILDAARNVPSDMSAISPEDNTPYITILADEFERAYDKKVQIWKDILQYLEPEAQIEYFLQQLQKAELKIDEDEIRRMLHVFKMNTLAEAHYIMPEKSYPVPITLFKAEDTHPLNQIATSEEDPTWGWGQISPEPVEIHVTPGDHYTMLMEPHVPVLAKQLQACLERVSVHEYS